MVRCMYTYVNTLVIRFNPIQKVSISDFSYICLWLFICVHYRPAGSPLTSCYIITSNGLIALFTCFTQVLPHQTYCLLDPDTKVGSFVFTALAQRGMAWLHVLCTAHIAQHCTMAHIPSVTPPPRISFPHTPLLAFSGNLGQFSAAWWLLYHDPPHFFLLFLPMPAY